MKLPNITPGPWATKQYAASANLNVVAPEDGAGNTPVVEIFTGWPNPEANARAIAAVPLMLEALNRLLESTWEIELPGQIGMARELAIAQGDAQAALLAAGCTD